MYSLRGVAALFAGLCCCTTIGGPGDECVTPSDCEVGLQCFAGECTEAELVCGEGTEEVEGVPASVPSERACTPIPTDVTCGPGTRLVDGFCVPATEER